MKFCGKTVEETTKSIDATQNEFTKNFDKYEYDGIQNTIQINGKTTKKFLQQCKFKKYNYFNP